MGAKKFQNVCLQAAVLCVALAVLSGCASNGGSAVTKGSDPSAGPVEEALVMKTGELHNYGDGSAVPEAPDTPEIGMASVQGDALTWGDPLSGAYLIEPGDTLMFRSFDEPTLDQQVVVRFDGNISLPLIPDVNVNLLTREEAEAAIRDGYGEVFIDPQISLSIVASTSKFFQVMGDVQQPARYPYERRMTILDAINTAGGPRINQRSGDSFVGAQGSLSKALIIRNTPEGERMVVEFDLRGLSTPGPHPSEAPVYPGDLVYVPEGVNLVYIIGEVPRPNVYALAENTTLLRLLAQAGGISFATGKVRRVVLLREIDSENTEVLLVDLEKVLKTGQDILLKPGDVIYVPRKDLIRLQQFVQRFTGSISPVLSLYTQALRTYYEKDFIDNSLDVQGGSDLQSILNAIQGFSPGLTSLIP
jgi:polysaccharide biosynthesis/export protein